MLSQAQACANALVLMSTDMYLGVTSIIRSLRLKYKQWRDELELHIEMSVLHYLVDTDHAFLSTGMC